jgi:hypothetical protein
MMRVVDEREAITERLERIEVLLANLFEMLGIEPAAEAPPRPGLRVVEDDLAQ